ncbi:sialidase-3-like [Astatotilapia calliptera]|uniref:exo-alpha-sialidase n=1 Tax=Astatotilapia calliptera TaxID=8154 RepID=A0AAX7VW46_ASTCA|nr:sialidase-3-like [Astatotilapia calliptera]
MGCGCSTTAQLQKQPVFESKEAAQCVYRIPALLYEKESKTLLAFAEQRKTSDDASGEKLVMRTGKMKEDSEKTVEWSELKQLEKALIKGYRPMNPCPVYDKVNNKLFLFFICVEDCITEHDQIEYYDNRTRLCYITSEDLGETWSDVTDLTDKLSEIKNWSTFAVGPGHGIQTESGRLIIPVYAYCRSTCLMNCCCKPVACSFSCCCKSYALSLYSDDPDKSWKFGQTLQSESGECQMAEVYEDTHSSFIYCNARSFCSSRVEAVSVNKGFTFRKFRCTKLTETKCSGCQGSVVSFPAQEQSGTAQSETNQNKWLLFTHPTSKSRRIDLGVYLNKSPRDPKAWSQPCIINDGPSGYSDLAYIDDGCFACLFECGQKEIHEQIASVVFSYKDITKK